MQRVHVGRGTVALSSSPLGVDALTREQLDTRLGELEKLFDADCLTSVGPIAYQIDDVIRDEIEEIENKKDKLIFIIESIGNDALDVPGYCS